MDNRKFLPLIVTGVAGLIFIIALSSSIFLTIKPGEAGVLFHKFGDGLKKDQIYGQGFHVIAPWNTMFVYNVKEQTTEEAMDVLDKSAFMEYAKRFIQEYDYIFYVSPKGVEMEDNGVRETD